MNATVPDLAAMVELATTAAAPPPTRTTIVVRCTTPGARIRSADDERVVTVVPPGTRVDTIVDRWRHALTVDFANGSELDSLTVAVLAPWRPTALVADSCCLDVARRIGRHLGLTPSQTVEPADAKPAPPGRRPGHGVLLLHRHPYDRLLSDGRPLLPVEQVTGYLLTHDLAVQGYDAKHFPYVFVCNFDAAADVHRIARWIIDRHEVRAVAAYHEKSLDLAAELRAEFGLAGMTPEQATLVRDKAHMKAAVAEAGLATPETVVVAHAADLARATWGSRAYVLKCRRGVGSQFQTVVTDLDTARGVVAALPTPPGGWLLEGFVPGGMLHVDGVVTGSNVVFASSARYLANPGSFRERPFGGSELLPPGSLRARVEHFHENVVKALGITDCVTHLEVFLRPDGELVFCEIAARPPGGGIDLLVRHACGVNLFEPAIRLSAGLPYSLPATAVACPRDAWAMVGRYASGGQPRHSADYADLHLLRADSPTELRARVRALTEPETPDQVAPETR